MFVEFFGRFVSMLLIFAPVVLSGGVLLFVFEIIFGNMPKSAYLKEENFSSVWHGALQGIVSPYMGTEIGNRARELSGKGASANGLCAYHCIKILWSPEGFGGICAILNPLYALLRGAIGLASAFVVGFFFTASDDLKKLRKTDPEKYLRCIEERKREKQSIREECRTQKRDIPAAALRAMKNTLLMLPDYLLGCCIGAGFATALPDTFFADIDLDKGVMVLLLLVAFGFLAGTSGISLICVGFGLGLCGMGIGGVFLFLSCAPLFNMTELYRIGRAVGRFKPLVYMAVHTFLSFVAAILLDDFVNARMLNTGFSELPAVPTELDGFSVCLICMILYAVLCICGFLKKNKREEAEPPKGHLLKLDGLWTEEKLSGLSDGLSAISGVNAVYCDIEHREVRVDGDADFSDIAEVCAQNGFELLMMEE